MREDVNDLLDHAAGWYEPDAAPDASPIAKIAGARRRRRRLSAIALSAVLTLGTLAFVVGALSPGRSPQPPAGSHVPGRTVVPGPHEQIIGYHGLEITVPASWKINDTTCGVPQGDTVIRDEGAVLTCLVPAPKGINVVELVDNPDTWLPQMQSTSTSTNAQGVEVQQGTVPGRGGVAVYVPAVQVMMFVETVTDSERNAIIDSITTADTDPNGCAMHQTQLQPPDSYQPDPSMQDTLIPGSPSSIAICHYVDYWLASSASVTGQEMADMIGVINGLPEGLVHADPNTFDPSFCDLPSSEGGELQDGFILWVQDADAAPVPLWAHVGTCGHLGISNGARDGQLTPALAEALYKPLHAGYGFSGSLIPDSP